MIKTMNNDREWLLRMAAAEDNAALSVGGLGAELSDTGQGEQLQTPRRTGVLGLSKMVELRRRERRLTIEQLAKEADVDVEEILAIESGEYHEIEPRTVFQLARVLKVPGQKLLVLSGLVEAKDEALNQAIVRFAARSQSIEELTQEEHEALKDLVRFLGKA